MYANKKDVRSEALKRRDSLTTLEREQKSRLIIDKLIKEPEFIEAENILTYINFRSEVETKSLVDKLLNNLGQKNIYVPKVLDSVLEFYRISSMEDLIKGYMGISEPKENVNYLFKDQEKTLIIMPGCCFDESCNRIGYGGGFYDKYLNLHNKHKTIALAFENQILKSEHEELLMNEMDIKPDKIITEKRILVNGDKVWIRF